MLTMDNNSSSLLLLQKRILLALEIDISNKSFEEIQLEMAQKFSTRKSNLQPTYAQHSLIQLKKTFLDILEELCCYHQYTPENTKAIKAEFLKEVES